MYGVLIWISKTSPSAIILTEGGTKLCFGRCAKSVLATLNIGDLVFAPDLNVSDRIFKNNLVLISQGYWPEVTQVIYREGAMALGRMLYPANCN